jgi:hypothetical protein
MVFEDADGKGKIEKGELYGVSAWSRATVPALTAIGSGLSKEKVRMIPITSV